jgi:hypothetical protein
MYLGHADRQVTGQAAPQSAQISAAHDDHEYKRHGTVTLMAGIDLLTGQVHALSGIVIAVANAVGHSHLTAHEA